MQVNDQPQTLATLSLRNVSEVPTELEPGWTQNQNGCFGDEKNLTHHDFQCTGTVLSLTSRVYLHNFPPRLQN
jgi:hypothetical protein